MDIVLEAFDTFLFDPIYATLLPGNATALVSSNALSARKTAFGIPDTRWEYAPASQYLSFEPRKYAYMSRLSRDDWRRQLLNLYIITWYALCYPKILTKND
jgi:lathosterol oxidase